MNAAHQALERAYDGLSEDYTDLHERYVEKCAELAAEDCIVSAMALVFDEASRIPDDLPLDQFVGAFARQRWANDFSAQIVALARELATRVGDAIAEYDTDR